MLRGTGINGSHDGIIYKNLLASYTHLQDTDRYHWVEDFVAFMRSHLSSTKQIGTMPYKTLISTHDLTDYIDNTDWVIVDCRFDLADASWGKRQYLESHIPGAVYAHLNSDLASPVIPGATGRHPLPDIDEVAKKLSAWGIDQLTQVIVYDQDSGMFAARLWWLLRWLGHEKVAVLDGGWQKWKRDGLPVQNEIPAKEPATFIPRLQTGLIADVDDVIACQNNPNQKLLDARSADRFRGENETLDPIAGHIPGAISVPLMDNLDADNCFRPASELEGRFRDILDKTSAKEAIVYCGSGVTTAHNILAMVHAGMDEPRLYAGSWSHWITDPSRPVSTGEKD